MSPNPIQNNSENKAVRKDDVYQEFITWYSIPPLQRSHTGIADQNEFSKHYRVSKDTLSLWKKRPDFENRVRKIRDHWALDKTGDVFDAIYRGAVKGRAASQKIWMKYFWHEPQKTIEPVLHVDDIRFLIKHLPEPLQLKYNRFLGDLLLDSRLDEEGNESELKRRIDLYLEEEKWLEEKRIKEDPGYTGKYL